MPRDILHRVTTAKPLSLEVFSDEFPEMKRQALKINGWANNVYVKIPITNTRRESSLPLIKELAEAGVKLNVTAILTLEQDQRCRCAALKYSPCASGRFRFAGRIADTGVDPVSIMVESKKIIAGLPQAELLWASVREVLNIFQASDCGCHIVTVPHDILGKAMKMAGMDLGDLSLDTVKMFASDAKAASFTL